MTGEEGLAMGVGRKSTRCRQEVRSQFRLVPPAVTPIRASDVAAAGVAHARGEGRDGFRREIESHLDASHTATYTSYRRALGSCLEALAEAAPDRSTVLVPAFCSSDYPNAIEGVGLEMERYEVDRETLALDVDAVERRIDDDTLAVISISVLGYGSPMSAVAELCTDRDVALVEALGYALGTTYRGQPLGSFGDVALLNFQEGKPIPVGGGMVASRDPAITPSDEGRPAVAPNVGAVAGYAAFAHPRLYWGYETVSERLDELDLLSDRVTTHPGSKRDVAYDEALQTMSNFQGELARRVLDRLPVHRRHRARTGRHYADALGACEGIELLRPVDGLENHQYVRFPVLTSSADGRDRVLTALRERGIQATTLYGWPEIDGDAYPAAASLQDRLLALPTHPYVSERDRQETVETVRSVLG